MNLLTSIWKVQEEGKESIPTPKEFLIVEDISQLEGKVLDSLARAYCEIFSEPPWNEKHDKDKVKEKLRREIKNGGRLVLWIDPNCHQVTGFCWGSIINREELLERTVKARYFDDPETVERTISPVVDLVPPAFLFLDEIAIKREWRGGLDPIRFLIRPLLYLGYIKGIKEVIFWTSPQSKVASLSKLFGFEILHRIERLNLIFMYHPNSIPLLKLCQRLTQDKAKLLAKIFSKIPK